MAKNNELGEIEAEEETTSLFDNIYGLAHDLFPDASEISRDAVSTALNASQTLSRILSFRGNPLATACTTR